MKRIIQNIICFTILFITCQGYAQSVDSIRSYWLQPVEITSRKTTLGEYVVPVEKDRITSLIESNGFSMIRKGVYFAQDVIADGFKRDDINIVIDGERFYTSCPNRMDSPLSRVNPLDIESIDLQKSSGSLHSGIGGVVAFKRIELKDKWNISSSLSSNLLAQNGLDFGTVASGRNQKLTLRYATGKPYEDADGNKFTDLYNYKENYNFHFAEAGYSTKSSDFEFGGTFSYTDDISFPYLKMDERLNRFYSGFVSYKSHKIYANYGYHTMDNDLRKANMYMETIADNLTIGAVGEFYEVLFRRWDADNHMEMMMEMNGMQQLKRIENNMVPRVNMYSANVHKVIEYAGFSLSGKLGLVHYNATEPERIEFHRVIYPDAKESRWFPTFGLGVSFANSISDFGYGFLLESASEAPEIRPLYIGVQKFGTNPWWAGNPELDQPVRITFRTSLIYKSVDLELFATNLWNYENPSRTKVGERNYLTYKNIDVYMLGLNARYKWELIDVSANYTYAQNKSDNSPLAEITPLRISTTLHSPEWNGLHGFITHTYNDAQKRVDEILNESKTGTWNKFDAGFSYAFNSFNIIVEVDNITNQQYSQHLSYMRDPFSSSSKVLEPGRTLRLSLRFNEVF